MPTYERLTYGSEDGAMFGNASTEPIGFYGATPVTRYVGVGAASTYATTTNTTSTTGFNSLAAMTSMIHQVSTITVALRNCGLID